jgi:hypothetical protein
MDAIVVALINGVFAIVLRVLDKRSRASGEERKSRVALRNRKAWLLLGLVFWGLIGILIVVGGYDPLLNAPLVIPAVSIPFAVIWPTRALHAAALIFLAFAGAAAAVVVAELVFTAGDLIFARGLGLPALWIGMSTVNAAVVWIICKLREKSLSGMS